MTETAQDFQKEVVDAAIRYERFERDELIEELSRLAAATNYSTPADERQLRKEGATLWNLYRAKLARVICAHRTPGGDKRMEALVGAGVVAFIDYIGASVLGDSLGANVTTALVGAAAALLYQDLQSGLDVFCLAHYTPEED